MVSDFSLTDLQKFAAMKGLNPYSTGRWFLIPTVEIKTPTTKEVS